MESGSSLDVSAPAAIPSPKIAKQLQMMKRIKCFLKRKVSIRMEAKTV